MRGAEWFIARRYLVSRERTLLASMITVIAMLGVAVGVAALIVVISVMDGADQQLAGRIVRLFPHIRIKAVTGEARDNLDQALDIVRAHPGVEAVIPKLEKRTLIQHGKGAGMKSEGIQLIALDAITRENPYGIELPEGMEKYPIQDKQILLGWPLGWSLSATPNSRVLLYANNPIMTAQSWKVKQTQVYVLDYFVTRIYDFDRATAFVNTNTLRKLFRMPSGFDYVHVRLADPYAADAVMEELAPKLPEGFTMTTWSGENKLFFSALKLEKAGLFVILLLAVIVAGFNIVCTMILVVNDKTREVGILKAIGATRRQISRIFMFTGVMIGMIGTLGGLGLGLFICWLITVIKLDMPDAVYQFSTLPVNVEPATVLAILGASVVITVASATIPARKAAKLHPVEALRRD